MPKTLVCKDLETCTYILEIESGNESSVMNCADLTVTGPTLEESEVTEDVEEELVLSQNRSRVRRRRAFILEDRSALHIRKKHADFKLPRICNTFLFPFLLILILKLKQNIDLLIYRKIGAWVS